jgi:hypothetical protein
VTGPKGTGVSAGTAGYHKGGDAKVGKRHMFVAMFTSTECRELLLKSED